MATFPRLIPIDIARVEDRSALNADLPGVDPASRRRGRRGQGADRARRAPPPQCRGRDLAGPRAQRRLDLRRLSLGEGIDREAIAASYANGVLSVALPVCEKAKARKVEVRPRPRRPSSSKRVVNTNGVRCVQHLDPFSR